MKTFKAYLVTETEKGFTGSVVDRKCEDLPENELLIKVQFSSINYKDYLSANGNKGITKQFPHTPGIDAVGKVEKSNSPDYKVGDTVAVMGHDLGMNTAGGWSEYISVPSQWAFPLPKGLTPLEIMQLGTAGFTAALGIYKLRLMEYEPYSSPILVTGATGGVGNVAVNLLSKLGYTVTAVSGKIDSKKYLTTLGASEIILRETLSTPTPKPLLRSTWGAAFDTVGGTTLVNILKTLHKNGTVVTCGSVSGNNIDMTVFPFILNGINLLGINAADTSKKVRLDILAKLATEWKPDISKFNTTIIGLNEINDALTEIAKGLHFGRFVINIEK